jgi:hypothetical protein
MLIGNQDGFASAEPHPRPSALGPCAFWGKIAAAFLALFSSRLPTTCHSLISKLRISAQNHSRYQINFLKLNQHPYSSILAHLFEDARASGSLSSCSK